MPSQKTATLNSISCTMYVLLVKLVNTKGYFVMEKIFKRILKNS